MLRRRCHRTSAVTWAESVLEVAANHDASRSTRRVHPRTSVLLPSVQPRAQTHDISFTTSEVRKRYTSWERGEPDREWTCLELLATHAPGVAPRPLRRETDADGNPVLVMARLPGVPLGNAPLGAAQITSLGHVLRQTYAVPFEDAVNSGIPERLYGPSTLPESISEWLGEAYDLAQCQDSGLVRRARDAASSWLAGSAGLPEPQLSALGTSDRKPANVLWDGGTCRLVDFEDSGLSDPAFELADTVEHIAWRFTTFFDPLALIDAVALPNDERERVRAYRALWACFWLVMLLPGNRGFRRNPLGTTEAQAKHLLSLID